MRSKNGQTKLQLVTVIKCSLQFVCFVFCFVFFFFGGGGPEFSKFRVSECLVMGAVCFSWPLKVICGASSQLCGK